MRGSRRIDGWPVAALTLILIGANIFAPFRTALGRELLSGLGHGAASRSAVRVRAVSRAEVPTSTAAVAPFSRAGFKAHLTAAPSGVLPPPTDTQRARNATPSRARSSLHLRC